MWAANGGSRGDAMTIEQRNEEETHAKYRLF